MTTTFADYPVTGIAQHPRNVRRAAVADDELVASVAASGILEPVVLGPEVDGVRHLIAGNRRFDAAMKAGLATVPAVLRDDLVTEAAQVSLMLQENLHRADLTVIEEAQAYEQLQLFGADATEIARTTGVSKATVKGRLRLATLPDDAKESVHTGDATLAEAMQLLDLHPDDQAEIAPLLGTGEFAYKARNLAEAREKAERDAVIIAGWVAAGIPLAADDDTWTLRQWWGKPHLQEPDAHDGCLAYRTPRGQWTPPYLVCRDPEKHTDEVAPDATPEADPAEVERRRQMHLEQEAREKARTEYAQAREVRLDALQRAVLAMLPTKGSAAKAVDQLARVTLPALLMRDTFAELAEYEIVTKGLGLPDTWNERHTLQRTLGAEVADGTHKPAQVRTLLSQVLAVLVESSLTPYFDDREDLLPASTPAWSWLEGTGYLLSSVDERTKAAVLGLDTEEDQA